MLGCEVSSMRAVLSSVALASLALQPATSLAEPPEGGVQVRKPKLMVVPESVVNRSAAQPPQFLSTHPGHASRIRDIEANLPKLMPLYDRANAR